MRETDLIPIRLYAGFTKKDLACSSARLPGFACQFFAEAAEKP